ncbi:MAG: PTS sugar transporter subunit IIA [Micropruina sp.]|uniref:PTS sugar transporter subunit IIA n=1 Tax=Micropruina sp. TaxID=2737536 RepID=UPI0039E2C020
MFPGLAVADRDELLQTLGGAVTAAGLAEPSYVAALQQREREFPTGLDLSGGVAIPHTSADHVSGNTIAVASLAQPVTFREMGGDEDSTVEVSTVFMLVFADAANHVPLLSHMIGKLQDADFVASVRSADEPAGIVALLEQAFDGI